MMYVLDTDHMSVLQRGGSAALALTLRLEAVAETNIATTIVSYEEQCKGWLAKTAREKEEGLIRAYFQFGQHLEIYAGMTVLPYDALAHTVFGNYNRQRFVLVHRI